MSVLKNSEYRHFLSIVRAVFGLRQCQAKQLFSETIMDKYLKQIIDLFKLNQKKLSKHAFQVAGCVL